MTTDGERAIFLTGYADPLAARAGETVRFMLHAAETGTAEIALVRLLHGDTNPEGPGFVERVAEIGLQPVLTLNPQRTVLGAYARTETHPMLSDRPAGTLHAFICPSRPGGHEQLVAGCWNGSSETGYALLIDADGYLCLRVGAGSRREVRLGRKLVPHVWYFVAGGWDADAGRIMLRQRACINRWNSRIGHVAPYELDDIRMADGISFGCGNSRLPFGIAGSVQADGRVLFLYNGKIDRPGLLSGLAEDAHLGAMAAGAPPPQEIVAAYWDTTAGYSAEGIGDLLHDTGPHALHATGVNRPIRGMTGWNWQGRDDCFRLAPDEYGGVAFHDDALIDCEWRETLAIDLPEDLASGVYALRVRMAGREDHVPFFVRPAKPRNAVAVLMPTYTYLAYANEHLAFEAPIAQAICANTPIVTAEELDWKAEEIFGLSTYDVHSDGAGVCYSSWRRPILNLRPRYRMPATGVPWAFPADLSLIWWLDHMGHDCDVITDHDLDREGRAALAPYKAVITGTHPEYHSSRMLDGIEDYLADGGRMLYLGGNGFYWVTATRPDEPWCIEVRKLDSGSRAWQAAPGEGYLATTGEKSGLWRLRGRAPQKLVGVGFTTEGMDESQPFERLPDAARPEIAWMFDGIADGELIGDFGLALGGASGIEMDRYDLALGTPPHALLLASSFGHSDNYPLVSEDVGYAFPGRGGTQDPQVRGDIVYFTTSNGGAVFAAGSIAWSQALPCFGGCNNVSRLTDNVLRAFLKDALPG